MTPSRVRVRLLALASAVLACALAGVAPATAGGGSHGDRAVASGRHDDAGHAVRDARRGHDGRGWHGGDHDRRGDDRGGRGPANQVGGRSNPGIGTPSRSRPWNGQRGRSHGRRHGGDDKAAGGRGKGQNVSARSGNGKGSDRGNGWSRGKGSERGKGSGRGDRKGWSRGNGEKWNRGNGWNRGKGNGKGKGGSGGGDRGGASVGGRGNGGNGSSGSSGGGTVSGRGASGGSAPAGGGQTSGPGTTTPAGGGSAGGGSQQGASRGSGERGSAGGSRRTRERGAARRRVAARDRSSAGTAPARRTATAPQVVSRVRPAPVIRRTSSGEPVVAPIGQVVLHPSERWRQERPAAGAATGFRAADQGLEPVTRTVERIVEVTPGWLKAAVVALAVVALIFGVHSAIASGRARRLARQREQLLDEVGLLQAALLPAVPERIGELGSTVAYRPADGPGAGGDFYDVFPIGDGRVGVVVGDVAGHGRESLARTALMRYTLRAYLDAGLPPRAALKVAGRVLDEDLGDDFATVVVAVYDPDAGTLTYAAAGHPPPILLGPAAHEPVTSYSSPPIGVGATTGLRQTTVGLPPGSVACFYTDGLIEARTNGELLGRERLAELLADLGPEASASRLLDRVAALADHTPDDMAACVLRPEGAQAARLRVEELEVTAGELAGDAVVRFLRDCGIPVVDAHAACREAATVARESGAAVLRVRLGDWRPGVDVLPGNVESFAGAARRRTAAVGAP